MTEDERAVLDEAVGRANAALSMVRMLMQVLVEADLVPPGLVLEGLDAIALATEEAVGDVRATPDTTIQLDQVRHTLDVFGRMPGFKPGRKR